jgi:hypothetical protein
VVLGGKVVHGLINFQKHFFKGALINIPINYVNAYICRRLLQNESGKFGGKLV